MTAYKYGAPFPDRLRPNKRLEDLLKDKKRLPQPKHETLEEMLKSRDKEVIILRGLPGCGKTHWFLVKQMKFSGIGRVSVKSMNKLKHCSADNYFYDDEFEYNFDPTKIAQAHNKCMSDFIDGIEDPFVETIVVDNTNLQIWEYENYIKMAVQHRLPLHLLEFDCPTVEVAKKFYERQNHNVPLDIYLKMFWRFEKDERARIIKPEEVDI